MNKAEKSLRWVVNQIPDFKPTTNEEKMLVAIKLYSEAGAEEIKRLESENAALRERLDKAVELSCKAGDTIYEVGGQYTKDIVAWTIREIILDPYGARFICDDAEGGNQHRCIDIHNNEMQTFFDKSPFCLTHTAAEKRISELGGEK